MKFAPSATGESTGQAADALPASLSAYLPDSTSASTSASSASSFPTRQTLGIVFVVNFVVTLLAYGVLTSMHFSPDSYRARHTLDGFRQADIGRWVVSSLFYLFDQVGYRPIEHQQIYAFFFVLVIATAATALWWRVIRLGARRSDALDEGRDGAGVEMHAWHFLAAVDAVVLIALVNVFMVEWFIFAEYLLTYIIAVTFCTLALLALPSGESKWRYLGAALCVGVAVFSYQASLGIFVILGMSLAMVACGYTSNRGAYARLLAVPAIGGAVALLNILGIKIGQMAGWLNLDPRTPTLDVATFVRSLTETTVTVSRAMSSAFGLLPLYLPGLVTLLLWAILLFGALKGRLAWSRLLMILVAYVVGVLTVMGPHAVAPEVWIQARAIVGLFALYTLLGLAILFTRPVARSTWLVLIMIGCFLLVNALYTQRISASQIAVNKLDQMVALQMMARIEEYEAETGTEITRVATALDSGPVWFYPNIQYTAQDLNKRAFTDTWADYALLRFVSGREFEKALMTEEGRAALFGTKDNWNVFDADEQMYFDGDTVYIAIY